MGTLESEPCRLCDGTGTRNGTECLNCKGDGELPPSFKLAEVREGEPALPMNTEKLPGTDWVTHYMTPEDAVKLGESLIDAAHEASKDD